MPTKVVQINLAEMTPEELIQEVTDNEFGVVDLMKLLDTLFDIWKSALAFSAAIIEHGEENHIDFLQKFIKEKASGKGVSPDKLDALLKAVHHKRSLH